MRARHQLVWPHAAAWQGALRAEADAAACECMALWAGNSWPLVVTRQHAPSVLSLGLPAPLAFGRRRVAIDIPHDGVARQGEFPAAHTVADSLDPALGDTWASTCRRLSALGCEARVYGGHGWQGLTGLQYVHAASDIDLALPVQDAAMADAVCSALAAAPPALPRLDGELLFPDGAGIAWREWLQWRRGLVPRVLVKRLRSAALECPPFDTA